MSLIFNMECVVLGVGTVGVHVERTSGVVFMRRCAKMEAIVIENTFCSGEVPVGLGRDGNSVM